MLGAVIGAVFLVWTGMIAWRVIAGAVLGLIGMSLLGNVLMPEHVILFV